MNMQHAGMAAGMLACLGMCLPWAHAGRLSVSGWHGTTVLMGVPCPCTWVAFVAAAALSLLFLRSQHDPGAMGDQRYTLLPLTMCGFGLFHTGFTALVLAETRGIGVGIGIPVTLLAFSLIVYSTFQAHHENGQALTCDLS